MDTVSALGSDTSSTMFKCFERGSTTWKPPCARKLISKANPFNTFPKIQQEMKILFAFLHQPNIIILHDVFEDADYVYLVMELGNGGELLEDFNQRYKKCRPCTEVGVVSVLRGGGSKHHISNHECHPGVSVGGCCTSRY